MVTNNKINKFSLRFLGFEGKISLNHNTFSPWEFHYLHKNLYLLIILEALHLYLHILNASFEGQD